MKSIVKALFVASLAVAAGAASADTSSPFPHTPDENGADMPYIPGGTYSERHHAETARADGSSFPSVPDENGADQLYVPGSTYAERHQADVTHADGSSFPWVADENDADMPATPPTSRAVATRKPFGAGTGE